MTAATGVNVALARSPSISITARAAVQGFADRLGERRTADACLLVSELVTNAYRHGSGQIRLTIAMHDDAARFGVYDDGDATPQPATKPDQHGGYGLNIVARIADRWGTSSTPTHVWFELRSTPDVDRAIPAAPGARRRCVLCGRPLRAGQRITRVQGSTIHARCGSSDTTDPR